MEQLTTYSYDGEHFALDFSGLSCSELSYYSEQKSSLYYLS